MAMVGEILFKVLVVGLIVYGIFAIVTGTVLSDPEDGRMRMIRKEDDPRAFWLQTGTTLAFAVMLLWVGYIYGPAQVKKQSEIKFDHMNVQVVESKL